MRRMRSDTARRVGLWALAFFHGGAAFATVTHTANPLPQGVQQGGFEQPDLAVPSFQYAPAGSAWTLEVGGGLATVGSAIKLNGAVDPLGAADGDQVGFIQNTTDSRIFQPVNLSAGSYRLTVKSAQRPGNSQTLKARVNATDVLTLNPASSTAWQTFSGDFSVVGGSHLLSFYGLNTSGHTAFVDDVRLQSLGLLADGGFEQPLVPAATWADGPVAGSPWTGGGTGIAATGAVTSVPPPQGQQAGFVQAGSTLSQTFTVTQAGRYRLSLKSAQRPANLQTLKVLIDNVEVGLVEPEDENYSTFVFDGLQLGTGTHTLAFTGQDTVVGYIAMVDDVRLESMAGRARAWSSAATWSTGYVPQSGDSVTIPDGAVVVLDSNINLTSLVIEEGGELHCADQNLTVDAFDILVEGRLVCGSRHSPYAHQLTVTLHGERPVIPDSPTGMGRKFLSAMAPGVIELHGKARKSWTQLAANAAIGAGTITLAEPVDWQAGDKIVIAPTRANPGEGEVVTIGSVTAGGTVIAFSPVLQHYHHGQSTPYSHGGSTWTLDERAEVGLLSRNIRIQGDSNSAEDRFGGHMMTMAGSVIHASGIELYRMGQGSLLARYPFHWHMAGDVKGQYIHNSSVHESYNRCITVHRTNHAQVTDNVCYNFVGHGYFLEDGNEQYNTFDGNLGIWARKPVVGQHVLDTDYRVGVASNGPAVFWFSNPTNTVTDNVAAGTEGSGFWYHTENHVTGNPVFDPSFNPKKQPFGVFDGNRMHTGVQGFTSCELDGGTFGMEAPGTLISNFSASNVDQALWPCANNLESMNATFEHVLVANTPSGMVAPSPVTMRDTLFVAYTGNPNQHPVLSGEHIGAAIWLYDQGFELEDVRFVNYDKPQTSVFTNFGGAHKFVSNRVTGLSFDASPNVYKDIMDVSEWPYATVQWGDVIHDLDGSLLGEAGYAMVSDHPLMWDHACKRPAGRGIFGYACPYRYSRFMITNDRVTPTTPPVTVQRSDGVTASGPSPLSYRAVNEYIANAGYIHSYRYDEGVDRHYLVLNVANGMSGDTDVHEILDIPSNPLLLHGTGWSAAASLKDLMEGAGRRYFHNVDSASLFLKTEATGTDWFGVDEVAFCFTSIVGNLCQPYSSLTLNLPQVTITSPATATPGAVTLTASATQSGGGSISSLKLFVSSTSGFVADGAAPLTIGSLAAGSYAVKAVAVNSLGQSYTALQHLVVGEPVRRVAITSLAQYGTYTVGALPALQIALHGTDATPHHVRWWLNGVDKGVISGTSATLGGLVAGRNDIEVALVNDADNSARPERDRRTIYLVDNGELAMFENGIDRRMTLYPAGLSGPSEPPRFAWGFRFSSYGANDNNYDDTNLFVIPYTPGRTTPARYTMDLAPLQDWSGYQSITVLHRGATFDLYLVNNPGMGTRTRTLIGSSVAGQNVGSWNLPTPRTAVERLEFVQAQPTAACSYPNENLACWQYLYDIKLSPDPAM